MPIASISSWYDYTRSFGSPDYRNHMRYLHNYVSDFSSEYCHTLSHRIDHRSQDDTGDLGARAPDPV